MRLVVKQNGNLVKEAQFDKGPVYIGRQKSSQLFLPDISVSRQHTVIYSTEDGKWVAEDLGSANKTYLNDNAIHKAELKNGDILRISDFLVQVFFDESAETRTKISMADTLRTTVHAPQTVIRRLEAADSPEIKIPAKRAKEYCQAVAALLKTHSPDALLKELLDIVPRQFSAFHTWVGLRNQTTGSITLQAGRKRTGETVRLIDLMLQERITQSLEKKEYVLLPHVASQRGYEAVRSAIMAPILTGTGCYGIMYVDNAMDREHYNLADLDYLMLLTIQAGVILETFPPAG